jgi:hypothetical protein
MSKSENSARARMPAASYGAMRKRLGELLSRWGIWTPAELEEVAVFVERESVLYAVQADRDKMKLEKSQ